MLATCGTTWRQRWTRRINSICAIELSLLFSPVLGGPACRIQRHGCYRTRATEAARLLTSRMRVSPRQNPLRCAASRRASREEKGASGDWAVASEQRGLVLSGRSDGPPRTAGWWYCIAAGDVRARQQSAFYRNGGVNEWGRALMGWSWRSRWANALPCGRPSTASRVRRGGE